MCSTYPIIYAYKGENHEKSVSNTNSYTSLSWNLSRGCIQSHENYYLYVTDCDL